MPCNCGNRRTVDTRLSNGVTYEVECLTKSTRTFMTYDAAQRFAKKYDCEIRAISSTE